jgi:hypothetical protein
MGLLIDFYTGDEEKIVQAFKKGDVSLFDGSSIPSKKADFTFHLNLYEDFDLLLKIVNAHVEIPSQKFEQWIEKACFLDPEDDPECALYRMSSGFRDLFAAIPAGKAKEIAEEWDAKLTEKYPVNTLKIGKIKRLGRKIEDIVQYCICATVFFIALAVVWMFSPKFRKESSENKRKLDEKNRKNAIDIDEYNINTAVADLVDLCQYAKSNNLNVLFSWCL